MNFFTVVFSTVKKECFLLNTKSYFHATGLHFLEKLNTDVKIYALDSVKIERSSGNSFKLKSKSIRILNVKSEYISLSSLKKGGSIFVENVSLSHLYSFGMIKRIYIESSDIEDMSVKSEIVNVNNLKVKRKLYISNIKYYVSIKNTKIGSLEAHGFSKKSRIMIENSVANKNSILNGVDCNINQSKFNKNLSIFYKKDKYDSSVFLTNSHIGFLNISECRSEGKICLISNTIEEKLSLYGTRARQLEIEDTTVSDGCDLRYLDIDRLCILKSCHFSGLVDLGFSYVAYMIFHSSNLRKLNIDGLFYKDIKVFDTKGLDDDGVQQELSDDNFVTKESGRLFRLLPNVIAESDD